MIKGFTTLEAIIVIMIISICMTFSSTNIRKFASCVAYEKLFISELLLVQHKSMVNGERNDVSTHGNALKMFHEYDVDITINPITFHVNANGNVSKASSICFEGKIEKRCITIQLGTGRVLHD